MASNALHRATASTSTDGLHPSEKDIGDRDGHLRSRVTKRSLVVGHHKTSVTLEDLFWNELRSIAHERHLHLSELVGTIDAERQHCNLSSAIRLFVFEVRCTAAEDKQPTGKRRLEADDTDTHVPRR